MTTTLINTGPGGTWTIDAPEGVTLATSQDAQGITTGLKIFQGHEQHAEHVAAEFN